MNSVMFKKYIRYLFLGAIIIFAANKFIFRPLAVRTDAPEFILIIVNSLPNFIEAIVGTMLLAGIAHTFRLWIKPQLGSLSDATLYLIASALAGVYVIAQELNIHTLGGNNIYDFNDVAASVLGLVVIDIILNYFGMVSDSRNEGVS